MGYINSIETMGTVDGPGIRTVVFLSGCTLRCLYCHNPETWKMNVGQKKTPQDIIEFLNHYKNYYGKEGGVTFSGGEPLLQPDFLIETMKLCQKERINTCLDTAGNGTLKDEEVLKYTDLVILDIKAINSDDYQKITGKDINKFKTFLNLCQKMKKRLWLRQVIVPGINDKKENIMQLKEFIKNIKYEKIELIPYHTYGKQKYKELGIIYPLEKTKAMDEDKLKELEKLLKE